MKKYETVSTGRVGDLPGKAHLYIDDSVPAVAMPSRQIPVALKPKVEAELERL